MFFLLSAAYIGWLYYWGMYKKDVPAFVHSFFYAQRKFDQAKDGDKPNKIAFFFLLLMGLLFVSYLGLLQPFFENRRPGYWFGSSFALLLPSLVFLKPFGQQFKYYNTVVRRTEEEDTVRHAYGARGWATYGELAARLGNTPGNGQGINIGNHWNWYETGHILTVGGAGSGKNVNLIIPALLSHSIFISKTSVITLDPKGENAAVAARYYKENGYEVHIVNPFHIPQIMHLGNSRWNPFDLIQPHEAKKMCDVMAFSLHNRQGSGDNSFFDNKCRQYISLYMRYALHTGNGNMNYVYRSLLLAGDKRKEHLAQMATNETFAGASEAENMLSASLGPAAKIEESIFATIHEAINILGDDALRESLSASDFDMREIAHKKVAIFICIKHDELRYYAAWVRMFTDMLLKTLTTHFNPEHKVLVLLDEFAQLGFVNEFKNSPAVLRGYNVTLWPIVQELGQLKSIYKEDWETFISNTTVKHWLGGGMDNTTAKYIEDRMPMDIRFVGTHPDGSPKEIQTKLMTAPEILAMNDIILELARLEKPALLPKQPYYNDERLAARAAPNPFYQRTSKK